MVNVKSKNMFKTNEFNLNDGEVITNMDNLTMGQAAKVLNLGRNKMMKMLRDVGILNKDNTPEYQYNKEELFRMKKKDVHTRRGELYFRAEATHITKKGLEFIKRVTNGENPMDIIDEYVPRKEQESPESEPFILF